MDFSCGGKLVAKSPRCECRDNTEAMTLEMTMADSLPPQLCRRDGVKGGYQQISMGSERTGIRAPARRVNVLAGNYSDHSTTVVNLKASLTCLKLRGLSSSLWGASGPRSLVLFTVASGTLRRSDATSYLQQGGFYKFRTQSI